MLTPVLGGPEVVTHLKLLTLARYYSRSVKMVQLINIVAFEPCKAGEVSCGGQESTWLSQGTSLVHRINVVDNVLGLGPANPKRVELSESLSSVLKQISRIATSHR